MGKTVAVLNMKGGVGKTTISAHVMRVLYQRKQKKVLLVDLDPQFNLTQCVLKRSRYEKLKRDGKTIYLAMEPPSEVGLFDVAAGNHPPPQVTDLALQLRWMTATAAHLHLVPGDFSLVKYSLIKETDKLGSVRTRFLQFMSMARDEYDLVVLDCNPSSSFLTTCALEACSHLIVPVRPDRYSVLGLELVADLVDLLPTVQPKPARSVILNAIPTANYDRTVEDELRAHGTYGPEVLAGRIRISSLLRADNKYTGFATDRPVANRIRLTRELNAIVDELAGRIGI